MTITTYLRLVLATAAVITVATLAACRREVQVAAPQVRATPIPTPRSTPLPPVPTTVPPGTEDHPLRMVLVPADAARLLEVDEDGVDALTRFEEAVLTESGLVLEVELVDRQADALAALCASAPGRVVVAWLDGLASQAALALSCGAPELQVERGSSRAQAGVSILIVTDRRLGLSSVGPLAQRTFCRLSAEDFESWLAPALILRAGGVDPVADLSAVRDYDDYETLLAAVASGECAAAGLTETRFEQLPDAVRDDIRVVGRSPALPYALLFYPINLPLGERLRLTDALLALALDPERAALLEPLFAQSGLARVVPDTLTETGAFLSRTGLDFAQLGN